VLGFRARDEQYPKGVGEPWPRWRPIFPGTVPIQKMSMSCCGAEEFMAALRRLVAIRS